MTTDFPESFSSEPASDAPSVPGVPLFLGLGERGKLEALAGRHLEALRYYREAMRRAEAAGAPEVFLRHFTQCALESLERMEAFDEVLATCDRAHEHYQTHPPGDDISRKDRASFLERAGVMWIKKGDVAAAIVQFDQAVRVADPLRMPLADTLRRWLRMGLRVSPARLEGELDRNLYWSVRAETVRHDWAAAVPGLGPSVFSPSSQSSLPSSPTSLPTSTSP